MSLAIIAVLTQNCSTVNKNIPLGAENLPIADRSSADSRPLVAPYTLNPKDELNVVVFGEPELTLEKVVVDSSGRINLPISGEFVARDKTTTELEYEVATALNRKYLRNADVSIAVVDAKSQVFTVDGEVKKPGTYEIPGNVTLLQALAIGEGVTERAAGSNVIVFRQVGGQRYAARFDINDIRAARSADPTLVAGDLVVVGFSSAKQIYRDIITALPGLAGLFIALNQ